MIILKYYMVKFLYLSYYVTIIITLTFVPIFDTHHFNNNNNKSSFKYDLVYSLYLSS